MRTSSLLAAAALVGLSLSLFACGDPTSPEADAGIPDVETEPTTCTVDPTLIAQRRACLADDQCPCGAHCELGECVASCGEGLPACSTGRSCDSFGRCRASDDTRLNTAEIAPDSQASLEVDSAVSFTGSTTEIDVRMRTAQTAISTVRIQVDAPLEVRCAADDAFASACLLSGVAASTESTITLRATSPIPSAGRQPSMRVYWGSNVETRLVTSPVLLRTASLDAPGVPLTAMRGVYRGIATRVRVDVGAAAPTSAPLADLTVPVSAVLYDQGASSGVLVLQDPLRALSTGAEWPMALSFSPATQTGTLAVPRRIFAAGSITRDDDYEVLVSANGTTTFTVDPATPGLSFEMDASYEEMAGVTAQPRVQWRITLSRVGTLDAGVRPPAIAADAVSTLPSDAASAPTNWEQTFQRTFTSWSSRPDRDYIDALRTASELAAAPRFDACAPGLFPLSDAAAAQVYDRVAENVLVGRLDGGESLDVDSVTTTPPSGMGTRGIPCAMTPVATDPSTCFAVEWDVGAPFDICTEVAGELGCEVVDAPADMVSSVAGRVGRQASGFFPGCSDTAAITATVTRVCVLPSPTTCGELTSCANGTGVATARFSTDATTGVLPTSGDLRCTGVPALAAAISGDRLRDDAAAAQVTDLVNDCLTDLARVASIPPTVAEGSEGAGRQLVFAESAGCIDATRHLIALASSTEAARRTVASGTPGDVRADRYAQRLIAQWLQVHALLAQEARERSLPTAITDSVTGGLAEPANIALERANEGAALLFHPRFATALMGFSGEALANPDYRTRSIPTLAAGAWRTQSNGVVVAMLDSLRAQLSLAERLLDGEAAGTAELQRSGAAIRTAVLIEALALSLHKRADAEPGALAWEAAYQTSLSAYRAQLETLTARASSIVRGDNALSIAEGDLPLYYFGTSTDPSSRFAAISDYLLGATPGSPGWAPQLVDEAQTAFESARTSYLDQASRQYRAVVDVAEQEDRVRAEYGESIASFCGVPGALTESELLEDWQRVRGAPFDAGACFIRTEDPTCRANFEVANGLINRDDVRLSLCRVKEVNRITGSRFGFLDERLNAAATRDLSTCGEITSCPSTISAARCITCGSITAPVTSPLLTRMTGLSEVSNALVAEADRTCRGRYPAAHQRIPSPPDVGNDPLANGACYRGSGGELTMTVRAAGLDAEIARSEMDEALQNYNIAMQSCVILQERNQDITDAEVAYQVVMVGLEGALVVANAVTNGLSATADCCYAISGLDGVAAVGSAGSNAIAAGVGCGASYLSVISQLAADSISASMGIAERAHESVVSNITNQAEFNICANDARAHLVGMRTASLRLARANTDLDSAQLQLREAAAATDRTYLAGVAALEEVTTQTTVPPQVELWLDRDIETFRRAMRRARRATYLSIRAVEYEYQTSLVSAEAALSAQTPAELTELIAQLRGVAGPRQIGGNSPNELKLVISLRDQLLRLADRSDAPSGEHALTDEERFELLLQDGRFAAFNDAGVYIGQRIPFSIAPTPLLGAGVSPVFASNDCAERVWSVNASIVGTGTLFHGSDTTFTRIDLLKSNTFYSQWCDAPAAGEGAFQIASVRPSVNLFRDPLAGGGAVGGGLGVVNARQGYTRARIQAYFNVSRAAFEADSYENGDTSELAARGLYGDYALFIPTEVIARRTASDGFTDGLDLAAIDDILLRVDYVSVAAD